MTSQEQANEIILKYSKVLPSCCCFMDCVKCAITEVEACIAIGHDIREIDLGETEDKYKLILSHLKQM